MSDRCPLCGHIGWILDCNDLTKQGARCLEFIPCIYPPCPYSGRPLELVSFKGVEFRNVAVAPDGSVASVSR